MSDTIVIDRDRQRAPDQHCTRIWAMKDKNTKKRPSWKERISYADALAMMASVEWQQTLFCELVLGYRVQRMTWTNKGWVGENELALLSRCSCRRCYDHIQP